MDCQSDRVKNGSLHDETKPKTHSNMRTVATNMEVVNSFKLAMKNIKVDYSTFKFKTHLSSIINKTNN